jgi:heme/copper-type cytochrome/quinol oxidase subunit 4
MFDVIVTVLPFATAVTEEEPEKLLAIADAIIAVVTLGP